MQRFHKFCFHNGSACYLLEAIGTGNAADSVPGIQRIGHRGYSVVDAHLVMPCRSEWSILYLARFCFSIFDIGEMLMNPMLFDGWTPLIRTFVVGVLAYVGLVVILRSTGKRTLSKLNAFDLIVTVSLGSILATILLNKEVALAQGILAFIVLCGMQYVVTWASVRSAFVRGFVKSEPKLLLHNGDPLESAMSSQRVTRDEIEAAARSEGIDDLANVKSVILETDGTLSIIPQEK